MKKRAGNETIYILKLYTPFKKVRTGQGKESFLKK